jgi:hypothetical protein
VESANLFKGIVLIVLLVVGGVEVKPSPPAEQDTTDHILKQINNRDRESRLSQKLLETNNRQIGDVKNIVKEFEVNLENLSETVRVI